MAAAERMYARALFEAAQERDRLEPVQHDLAEFVQAVRDVPELRALLRDPVLDRRAKVSALGDVLADAEELVRNFVLVLTEQGRATELDETQREFERLSPTRAGASRWSSRPRSSCPRTRRAGSSTRSSAPAGAAWTPRAASTPTCSEESSSRSDPFDSTPVFAAASSGCAVNSHLLN